MEDQIPQDPHSRDLYAFALVLALSVKKMLKTKGGVDLSSEPVFRERKIVQFEKRMRVDGLEKFGDRTVFSSVHFYRDKSHLEHRDAMGALIIYIPVSYISKLMWMLDYPRIDEEDDDVVLDACGTVANLVAGYFVKDVAELGYVYCQMSHFESYINTALNGIEFSAEQEYKYEIDFHIKGEKRIVAELTMGKVPRSLATHRA